MSIEEKQNLQIFQDSDSTIIYPRNEREVADNIKEFYKSNIPVELMGSGSKRKIGKPLQCAKILNFSKGPVNFLLLGWANSHACSMPAFSKGSSLFFKLLC